MRLKLLAVLYFSLSLILMVSCKGADRDAHPEGSVQVKIPLYENGDYHLRTVSLYTVDDMVELKGWAAKFLFSPTQRGKTIFGHAPKVRTVRNSDGVYVATDELSLQLLTLYYHIENLAMLDEAAGAKNVNSWPRKIGVKVKYQDPKRPGRHSVDNALYSGDLDSMLFVPYTRQQLPIVFNGGVIGHEHFHSLFYRLVTQPLGDLYPGKGPVSLHDEASLKLELGFSADEAPDLKKVPFNPAEIYHQYLLGGLNEGLADFWGWLYSQDSRFVSRSLPEYKIMRDLDEKSYIPSEKSFFDSVTSGKEDGPSASAYSYGANVARVLREFTLKYIKERGVDHSSAKVTMARAVVASLKQLKIQFEKLPKDKTIDTVQILEIFLGQVGDLKASEKTILQSSIDRARSEKNGR